MLVADRGSFPPTPIRSFFYWCQFQHLCILNWVEWAKLSVFLLNIDLNQWKSTASTDCKTARWSQSNRPNSKKIMVDWLTKSIPFIIWFYLIFDHFHSTKMFNEHFVYFCETLSFLKNVHKLVHIIGGAWKWDNETDFCTSISHFFLMD